MLSMYTKMSYFSFQTYLEHSTRTILYSNSNSVDTVSIIILVIITYAASHTYKVASPILRIGMHTVFSNGR